jgi:ubiquinone/menaquinone biosynthesis C-methylase UbiE
MINTTEVTTYEIASDNVLNNRLLFAYHRAAEMVQGNMLEVGCGTGKGLTVFPQHCTNYTAVDKNDELIGRLSAQYPQYRFINRHIPPLADLADNTFDTVVSLQVIEHIEDDHAFVSEIYRVLKPGGKAIIATPNIKLTLSRNPWHVREYTAEQLNQLMSNYFDKVQMCGVRGNDTVMEYHQKNRDSIARITRFDIFNLQYRLPRALLQVPYEILNRLNRNRLMDENQGLVSKVTINDFSLDTNPDGCLDLFCIVKK